MKKITIIIYTLLLTLLTLTSCSKPQTLTVTGKLPAHMIFDDFSYDFYLVQARFEYDDQGRIISMLHTDRNGFDQTITVQYKGKKGVTFITSRQNSEGSEILNYAIKGNKITMTNDSYADISEHNMLIDKSGYIIEQVMTKIEFYDTPTKGIYKYHNGNLINELLIHYTDHGKTENSLSETQFFYDEKKSPFIHSNTPKWVSQLLLGRFSGNTLSPYISKNNLIKMIVDHNDYEENWETEFEAEYDSEGYLRTHTTPTPLCAAADVKIYYIGESESDSNDLGFYQDPDFSIYGEWEWTMDEVLNNNSDTVPTMTVSGDETYITNQNNVKITGIFEQTDTYEFIFTAQTIWQDGEESAAQDDGRRTVSEYDPNTNILMYRPGHHTENAYRKITEHEFKVYPTGFKPINIFYTPDEEGGHTLDRLEFIYDKKVHSVNLHGTIEPLIFWSYDPENFYHLKLTDYNFDEHKDIAIRSTTRSGASTDRYEIFMYNPKTKDYNHHKELSELDGLWVDEDTKTVKMSARSDMDVIFEEYRWEGEKLVLVRKDKSKLE